jgi:hypothetical protein
MNTFTATLSDASVMVVVGGGGGGGGGGDSGLLWGNLYSPDAQLRPHFPKAWW